MEDSFFMRGRICRRTTNPENRYIRNKLYSFTNCLTDTSDKTVPMRKVCWYFHTVDARHRPVSTQRRQCIAATSPRMDQCGFGIH